MIKTYKQAFENSWLISWDGIQNAIITTNNRFMKMLYNGIDNNLNIVALKLLRKFDFQEFLRVLSVGVEFEYQTHTYILGYEGKRLNLIVIHTKTNTIRYNHRLSKQSYKHIKAFELNDDISDILSSLESLGII